MPSLYVHVPFCQQKCSYCAFYSLPLAEDHNTSCLTGAASSMQKYLKALALEVKLYSSCQVVAEIFSVFVGGGTPTVLPPQELEELLNLIERGFLDSTREKPGRSQVREFTVECNPGTIDSRKVELMVQHKVNRISLGVQSFDDEMLRRIGRIHNSRQVIESVDLIKAAGIRNINFDLIFGLPGQSLEEFQYTLQKAVSLSPVHFSLYALTIEPGTPLGDQYLQSLEPLCGHTERLEGTAPVNCRDSVKFANQDSRLLLPLPDDDLQADMYDWAVSYLAEHGYQRYEISNFALPGFECQHNLAYWKGEEYLGLGPGAVSCLNGIRYKNAEDVPKYGQDLEAGLVPIAAGSKEELTREQRISEYMMLGLRTAQGIDIKEFEDQFSCSLQDIYGQILENYINRKMLIVEQGRLRINPKYFFVANAILQNLML